MLRIHDELDLDGDGPSLVRQQQIVRSLPAVYVIQLDLHAQCAADAPTGELSGDVRPLLWHDTTVRRTLP
ncbi:hypothetical protein AQJ66_19075 [Streptomyces bungoensis]|uniref:Uncharacterized protein n=1 Tax=Streptomyces bungoensis TaxID=285568 RepID=A0A124I3D2_9ACTN|nr:hypothetical protein AQJ66_19075 [Streptomyces bungoensis]